MNMISQINSDQPQEHLLHALKEFKVEVGMVEFGKKKDVIPIAHSYVKVGNFELDILAIDEDSNKIVMLDHDQPNFVMGVAADDLASFVEALKPVEMFLIESDDELLDDEAAMSSVASEASELAGGEKYVWFYRMMFGI